MQAFGALALTIIRHFAAVIAAWIGTVTAGLTGAEVGAETIAGMESELTAMGVVLMLSLYAAVEKALKPIFARFGERDVTPPATPTP